MSNSHGSSKTLEPLFGRAGASDALISRGEHLMRFFEFSGMFVSIVGDK